MPPQLRPIDWDAPYGTDWAGMQISLVHAPTFYHARIEVQRRPLVMPNAIMKTGLWGKVPDVPPKNARESLSAIRRVLIDADWDYWHRYQGEHR
jgi:hypothetical protein